MAARQAKDQAGGRGKRGNPSQRPPVRPPWLLLLLALAAVVAAVLVVTKSPDGGGPQASPATAGNTRAATTRATGEARMPPPPETLVGRWQRTDGDYALDIRRVHPDGRAEAAYTNPGPINVSRAEVKQEGNRLILFVERRDVNYPGSKYMLAYQPGPQEALIGSYHQRALGQTYEVGFLRAR